MRPVRGSLLVVFAVGFFALIFLPSLALPLAGALSPNAARMNREMVDAATPIVRALGPLILLLFLLLSVVSNWGEAAIYFPPAEVDFLFSAPFGRRELLLYKLTQSLRSA